MGFKYLHSLVKFIDFGFKNNICSPYNVFMSNNKKHAIYDCYDDWSVSQHNFHTSKKVRRDQLDLLNDHEDLEFSFSYDDSIEIISPILVFHQI